MTTQAGKTAGWRKTAMQATVGAIAGAAVVLWIWRMMRSSSARMGSGMSTEMCRPVISAAV